MPDHALDRIEAKLSALRAAAETFSASSARIQASVERIQSAIHEAHTLAPEASASLPRLNAHDINATLTTLSRLSRSLEDTAHDVERAIIPHFPPLGALWRDPNKTLLPQPAAKSAIMTTFAPFVAAPLIAPTRAITYVSTVNRPLFEHLQATQSAMETEQAHFHTLQATRATAIDDLNALRNRLLSHGTTDADQQPRLQALFHTVHELDQDLEASAAKIDSLHQDLNQTNQRLLRVMPPDHANLQQIRALEGNTTADAIKNSTQDCVHHVVSKMPIPAGIARDAHLWDDQAALYPQYGIVESDQPLEGSVLLMEREHTYASDQYGHVMYVERVDHQGVWVTDNQYADPVLLHTLTQETSGENIKYLYFPWHTKA